MSEEEKPSHRIGREVTADLEKEEKKVRAAFEARLSRSFTDDEWKNIRIQPGVLGTIMAAVNTVSTDAIGSELDREWERRRAWERKIELELERMEKDIALELERMGKDIHGG